MKKPYEKLLGKIGDLKIWIVDGKYVRDKLNEEFTNCGEHYSFKFIPKNELWLDHEFGTKDEKYYIDYILTEYELMKNGVPYHEALKQGDILQERERAKEKEFKNLEKLKEKRDYELIDKIHKKLLKEYSNHLKVWIVNGKIVRDVFFVDYVEGGHDKVYSFIPYGEIWIDDDISQKERKYILLHEAHERYLMSKGENYRTAHFNSSKLEHSYRLGRKGLDKELKKELEKNDELIKEKEEKGYMNY